MPSETKALSGGWAKTFEDPKITRFFKKIGGVKDTKGFELGPLEAGHSWMAQNNGVKSLISVEANRNSFLKCLIIKNLLGMNNVQFKLGDSIKYLDSHVGSFDFILASGILYHLKDPISALELILSKTESLLVWTHYFDEKIIMSNPVKYSKIKALDPLVYNGSSYEIASYAYKKAMNWKGFCGGMSSEVVWLNKIVIPRLIILFTCIFLFKFFLFFTIITFMEFGYKSPTWIEISAGYLIVQNLLIFSFTFFIFILLTRLKQTRHEVHTTKSTKTFC